MPARARAARDEREQHMIRTVGILSSLALLAGCGGDGRGSPYSSARAQTGAVSYIPVTPGAQPVAGAQAGSGPVLTGPIAVTPGAVPILPGETQGEVVTTTLAPQPVAQTVPQPAPVTPVVRFATGPIYDACRGSAREGASRERCGCVQWVADRQLTSQQQRRGAKYFTDQHDLQEVRQSDDRSNAEFWEAWKAFGDQAGDLCQGT